MVTVNAKGSAGRLLHIGMAAALVLLGWSAGARAQVAASDLPGGYVVLPKIVVHTTGGTPPVATGAEATDTIVQLSNTNEQEAINVHCWWVNANSHCGDAQGPICTTNADCPIGLNCVPGWGDLDFSVTLTPGQPIGFLASSGLSTIPCDPSFVGTGCIGNAGGSVLGVPEDPFRGELKCVQVDADDAPVVANNLKIEATIVSNTVPPVAGAGITTAATYNGIGFEALQAGTGAGDDPLCLGSLPTGNTDACAATYAPCPGVLILNNFFEGATPEFGGVVNTDLTLVPCSEDLGQPDVSATHEVVAQMLVYNEFEQRFSTSARVECYRATSLADIDTQPGPAGDQFSIFSAGVQGTLTGQTRIRGVQGANGNLGYGLLGVACENYRGAPGGPVLSMTAFNLHDSGLRPDGDAVYREQPPPQVP
jgi:hypothetical protein